MATSGECRIATPADAQHIALLGRITFSETFGHLFHHQQDLLNYLDRTFSVDKIESGLGKSNNVFWISFYDKLPVAYAKLKLDSPSPFITANKVCQLQKIYVLRDFLSQKIGRKLQDVLLQKAKDLGYDHIWLSVLHSNDRAINFYRKNKFSTVGAHTFTIGTQTFDFMVMAKKLRDGK